MAEGSRLVDVVEAAGGFTDDADQDAVRLASRVFDEQHFRVPRLGEAVQDTPTRPQPQPVSVVSEKIDLNSAAVEALIALPNIGEVKARAIVSYREVNGPFPDVEAVLGVAGIGSATLAAIRDLVEVR
jgi:competence protein ComEA